MENIDKARLKADSLIKKARKERVEKGYRENLGYDSIHKLEDYMKTLGLSFQEEYKVTSRFYSKCDEI